MSGNDPVPNRVWSSRGSRDSLVKGQLISKANCQAVNSSKKRTNEFVFTSLFLEEIEDSKKGFRNYLTFSTLREFEKS